VYYNREMISIPFPGEKTIILEHLVCDVNGTLAVDGVLVEGVAELFSFLSSQLQIHMITADTHGKQQQMDDLLGLRAERIAPGNEAAQKAAFVRGLGAASVAAIGQGANDAEMLKTSGLGIAVLSREGLAVETLLAADLLVPDIISALEILQNPLRITATLRK